MPRYALMIAYDGTNFCGWQKQEPPGDAAGSPAVPESKVLDRREGDGRIVLRTVQEVVERAVREVVREPVVLLGASRTDSGVHARGQVAAFTTTPEGKGRGWPSERGTEPLVRAINSRLPPDVMVLEAHAAPEGFDPIGDCTGKAYTYTVLLSEQRPLWSRRWVAHQRGVLDVAAMARGAKDLVGEHDFAAFAAAGHGRQTTVRRIVSVTVEEGPSLLDAGREVRMRFHGTGFLYNQVRIMAGTLVEIGRGKVEEGAIAEILASCDRSKAGPTMPPEGLCLERIWYADEHGRPLFVKE
ncbi:MAG: tRNA pseudouridine synthase A [Phycisphaeraceae bacterium]|nr:tRNA pseudouridine synthase A [Phycisphaeraceae bacterium]